ncbi:MAG: tRNA lysidine(34) synthetase TilS [Bacteroidetes bacterium]|nr:tRNA lysidine(34) synthetase TilS [Bacteroidota bacterium]
MHLINRFQSHLQEKNLFRKEDLLIIALSGGVDSIVLVHLCHQLNYSVIIAHCNFQLRGEESNRDEEFVARFASEYKLPIHVRRFETEKEAAVRKLSIQETARVLRYEWLHQLAGELTVTLQKKCFILTAHHADDQTETILMHFFRGTGLKGLTGIPEKNGIIIRPLLPFFKSEILDYAKLNAVSSIEDSSNLSSKYTRNLFRNEIIPLLEQAYPTVKQNLLDNIRRFSAIEPLYFRSVQDTIKRITNKKGKEIYVSIRAIQLHNNDALLYELIHPYGFTELQIQELRKLLNAASGSYMVAPHTGNRIIRHRRHLIIAPPPPETDDFIMIEKEDQCVAYPEGNLAFKTIEWRADLMGKAPAIALVDIKDLTYPLILRRWKEGDYFYPLGMRKKKKIARFMIDQKLSRIEKEKTWVIESKGRIIWLVGYRIDDRFKTNENTQQVLRIEKRS